jgi:hypothetical protein
MSSDWAQRLKFFLSAVAATKAIRLGYSSGEIAAEAALSFWHLRWRI